MGYKKKDLKDIIAKGSLKQVLKLVIEDSYSGKDRLLSKEEKQAIHNRIQTNEDIRAYNQLLQKLRAFDIIFNFLDQQRRNYKYHMARLTGFTVMFSSYEQMESLLNDVMFILGDSDKREEVIEHIKKKQLSLAQIVDSEDKGFIDIDTGGSVSRALSRKKLNEVANEKGDTKPVKGMLLEDLLYFERYHAKNKLGAFKGTLRAYNEIMRKELYGGSKFHKDIGKEYEEEAMEYQGLYKGYNPEVLEVIPTSNPRVREELERFYLYPRYEEIEEDDDFYNLTWDTYKKHTG